jgi:pimeloyl-ACP methyl ester carboxylesterase
MFDKVLHKWLKVPYTLHVRYNRRPKRPKATVLFIHGIGNSGEAWREVIDKLPKDIRVVTIDLLGFGNSPRPEWATYNAKMQANSVLATFFQLRISQPVIIVGHSLGSLVAVEIAKRYPLAVRSLILCSPPFYDVTDTAGRILPKNDHVLRRIYRTAVSWPDQFVKLTAFATRYKLINDSFNVTEENIDSYISALESMIINQTSFEDAKKLRVPTHIIKGTLDPFVVPANLRTLTKLNPHITIGTVVGAHEVRGMFVGAIVKRIDLLLHEKRQRAAK